MESPCQVVVISEFIYVSQHVGFCWQGPKVCSRWTCRRIHPHGAQASVMEDRGMRNEVPLLTAKVWQPITEGLDMHRHLRLPLKGQVSPPEGCEADRVRLGVCTRFSYHSTPLISFRGRTYSYLTSLGVFHTSDLWLGQYMISD